MTLDFTGRTALFVGGPGLLCGALAERLSERGAAVFTDAIGDSGPAPAVITETGRLDILVINGEIGPGPARSTALAESVGVDLGSRLGLVARALDLALPRMRANGYGRVLSIAPAAGAFGSAADPAGAALAGALQALMKSLAAGRPGGDLCVNTLSPLVGSAMTAAFFEAVPTLDPSCFDTEGPLALAIHLCHEACTVTGESFSAGAGRFARIFPATAPGLFQPGLGDEQIGANLAAIMDPEGYIVPRDAPDELVLVAV
jgi:NAD(P)-dependent dehydrogenase (short-subunit alcohol dehydrogenase family)